MSVPYCSDGGAGKGVARQSAVNNAAGRLPRRHPRAPWPGRAARQRRSALRCLRRCAGRSAARALDRRWRRRRRDCSSPVGRRSRRRPGRRTHGSVRRRERSGRTPAFRQKQQHHGAVLLGHPEPGRHLAMGRRSCPGLVEQTATFASKGMALASEGRWPESRGVEEAAGCCTPAQEAIAAASRQDPMRRRLASPPRWGAYFALGADRDQARAAWPESRCGNEAFLNVLRNPAIVISSCSSGLRGAWLFPRSRL